MSDNELVALKYFYLSAKKQLKNPNVKGMARKSCFELVKTIKNLASNLSKINDLEEVLYYED